MSEEKKSKRSPQVWRFYSVQGSSVTRLRKECIRCGKGVFLAEHEDRYACGKCGYTQFKKRERP
ncbi:MAG: 30S ribosomal protein S27ae [Nitrososphaerota archaeon]